MKRIIKSYFLGFITASIIFVSVNVYAENINRTIEVAFNAINISVNGKILAKLGEEYTLSNGQKVPYSIGYKGTTYLPIRKVAEFLDKDIRWNGDTYTATINDKGLVLDDYSNALYIKGDVRTLYTGAEYDLNNKKVISYDRKFENAYFLKMYDKYSNMGNNFISTEVLFELFPEYKNEIIANIQYFEVTKYNEKLYLGMVQVSRFYREKNIEFQVYDINDTESYVTIKVKE